MIRLYARFLLTVVPFLTLASACSSSGEPSSRQNSGTGGTTALGGSTGVAASGSPGSGGTVTTGGSVASGGLASGGTSGGAGPAAGSSGTAATGGSAGSSSGGASPAFGGAAGSSGAAIGGAGSGGSAGGSAGTAGNASSGAGGAGGSTAGGATSSGGSAGASSGSGFLTEGFEGPALPAGWDNFIGYVKNGMNPQGEYLVAIDTSKKHSGTASVHFHGGSTPAMLTHPLPANTNKLYVRVWVWLSRQLGNNSTGNHETLLGLRKISGKADDEVRFGEIKGAIGVNVVPKDALSLKPELWNKGPSIAKEKWVCLEAAFLGDKATHEFYAWADGMEVHKITDPSQWHAPMPADFLSGEFVEFIIGWHSFSSSTADVWADDLVLSNERVGCN